MLAKHMPQFLCRTKKRSFQFLLAKSIDLDSQKYCLLSLNIWTSIPFWKISEAVLITNKMELNMGIIQRKEQACKQTKRWKQEYRKPTVGQTETEVQLFIDTSLSVYAILTELTVSTIAWSPLLKLRLPKFKI